MKLLITGGSGYVGTRLTNYLLQNHKDLFIYNYDISFFGDDHLPIGNKQYYYLKEDIRDQEKFEKAIRDNEIDIVIHLACISNDPTFELNSKISKIINYDCFEHLVKISKKNSVKKFIYASTSSVYGISNSPRVDETHELVPLTDYNKFKAMCEPILNNYINDDFQGVTIRPATVCGFSEKMRFDLTVNILTNFAYNKKIINIFGGEQYRPNLHIDDMCRLYELLIFSDTKKINGEIFNAGVQNLKVSEIALMVKKIVESHIDEEVKLNFTESNDKRSYRVTSDKIKDMLNFNMKKNVEDAINDICLGFKNNSIKNSFDEKFSNIKVLQKLNF
ncbi:SDR family oxidoreductase [Candidatus Pelagibacter sp.]|nr:SDR family oxidoreductase [Candidatus Pelagibacter sp.]